MAWSTPKVDWAPDDAIGTTDFNRIENNALSFIYAGISEAANGRMGLATFSGESSKVVSNTSVTANTRIFLTVQSGSSSAHEAVYVSARTPGASFTIHVVTDGGNLTGTVAYLLIEPQ